MQKGLVCNYRFIIEEKDKDSQDILFRASITAKAIKKVMKKPAQ